MFSNLQVDQQAIALLSTVFAVFSYKHFGMSFVVFIYPISLQILGLFKSFSNHQLPLPSFWPCASECMPVTMKAFQSFLDIFFHFLSNEVPGPVYVFPSVISSASSRKRVISSQSWSEAYECALNGNAAIGIAKTWFFYYYS